jgi:hypothetical protein
MLMRTPYELERAAYDRQRHLVRMAELARAWRAVTQREPGARSKPVYDATRSRVAMVE